MNDESFDDFCDAFSREPISPAEVKRLLEKPETATAEEVRYLADEVEFIRYAFTELVDLVGAWDSTAEELRNSGWVRLCEFWVDGRRSEGG